MSPRTDDGRAPDSSKESMSGSRAITARICAAACFANVMACIGTPAIEKPAARARAARWGETTRRRLRAFGWVNARIGAVRRFDRRQRRPSPAIMMAKTARRMYLAWKEQL
eukprot:171745-Prymnesium_polylepis.1